MYASKRPTALVPVVCFGITIGALIFSFLFGVAHTARAQGPSTERVAYSFVPGTGYNPTGVIRDTSGNLYVATGAGGSSHGCTDGCGNILKLSDPGKATVLYTFMAVPPTGSPGPSMLIRDAKGNLYGATSYGGSNRLGSVFELTPSGEEGTLHNFAGGNDGEYPIGGLTKDSAGNLYGTTGFGGGTGCGGEGCGVVYKVTHSGTETVLYSFTGGADGRGPEASPILDATGNLYGTAAIGGNLTCLQGQGEGCGTVWKLDTLGNLTILYSFMGGTDGAVPAAGLVLDPSGNLYGDAFYGGDLACNEGTGCGVAFKVDSSGNFTVLHTFTGGANDGFGPLAALLRDSAGNLYGTTVQGGDQSCTQSGVPGCGVVFKLDASGNETILHAFAGATMDGAVPTDGALITDGKGNLYGTTAFGGVANGGVIFAVRKQ
jgi:uncharacterized repeat protein (TIGR03803 family)